SSTHPRARSGRGTCWRQHAMVPVPNMFASSSPSTQPLAPRPEALLPGSLWQRADSTAGPMSWPTFPIASPLTAGRVSLPGRAPFAARRLPRSAQQPDSVVRAAEQPLTDPHTFVTPRVSTTSQMKCALWWEASGPSSRTSCRRGDREPVTTPKRSYLQSYGRKSCNPCSQAARDRSVLLVRLAANRFEPSFVRHPAAGFSMGCVRDLGGPTGNPALRPALVQYCGLARGARYAGDSYRHDCCDRRRGVFRAGLAQCGGRRSARLASRSAWQ